MSIWWMLGRDEWITISGYKKVYVSTKLSHNHVFWFRNVTCTPRRFSTALEMTSNEAFEFLYQRSSSLLMVKGVREDQVRHLEGVEPKASGQLTETKMEKSFSNVCALWASARVGVFWMERVARSRMHTLSTGDAEGRKVTPSTAAMRAAGVVSGVIARAVNTDSAILHYSSHRKQVLVVEWTCFTPMDSIRSCVAVPMELWLSVWLIWRFF